MDSEARSGIQIENGEFSRIHNAILEKLAVSGLNGSEFRCVMFLLRKTYGWNRKEEQISFSQWEEGTEIGRSRVFETVSGLVEKKIIYKLETEPGMAPIYGFNKYFDQWALPKKDSKRSRNFQKKEGIPELENALLKEETIPEIENTTITELENSGVPELENGTIPEIGNSSVPELENGTIPEIGNSSVPELENGTIPEIGNTLKDIKNNIKNTVKDNSSKAQKRALEPPKPERNLIFENLAKICKVDVALKRGMLNRYTKQLIDTGYTSDDVLSFENWWYIADWRGARGQPPTINQVTDLIKQAKDSHFTAEIKAPPPIQTPRKRTFEEVMQDYDERVRNGTQRT